MEVLKEDIFLHLAAGEIFPASPNYYSAVKEAIYDYINTSESEYMVQNLQPCSKIEMEISPVFKGVPGSPEEVRYHFQLLHSKLEGILATNG